jgi:hypothetical protein
VGAVSNFGVGSHGPARNTVYENGYIAGSEFGVYERGRGAIVRDMEFGPGVKYPAYNFFGGRFEFYDNVVDSGIFSDIDPSAELNEVNGFGGNVTDAIAECLVVLGANLAATQADSNVIVRDNIGRVKRHLVQVERTGAGTISLDNVNVYDNEIEFFPASSSDVLAVFGKHPGSSSASVAVRNSRVAPNRMRTAAANLAPVLYDAEFLLSSATDSKLEFGDGRYSIRLADDAAGYLPVAQLGRDRILVAISVEETTAFYYTGWLTRDSATNIQIVGAQAEILAAAPTGTGGTDGRLQLHFGGGKLTIGNRPGANRTFNVEIFSMG